MDHVNEVKQLRDGAGLSQRALADLSGVAQSNIAAYESGARRPSAKMVERLRRAARPRPSVVLDHHRADVLRIAGRYGASRVRVFGSVARGEDRPGSDIDFLVRFAPTASAFDQVELAEDLEGLLGVRVDVVSDRGLRTAHEDIRSQARPL